MQIFTDHSGLLGMKGCTNISFILSSKGNRFNKYIGTGDGSREKHGDIYIERESENRKYSIQPSIGQEKSRHIFTDMIGLKVMSKGLEDIDFTSAKDNGQQLPDDKLLVSFNA